MTSHIANAPATGNPRHTSFQDKISSILSSIHPDVVWRQIDDPLQKISSQWPRPVISPGSEEACCRLLEDFYCHLLRHWRGIPSPMSHHMASTVVAATFAQKGGYSEHITHLVSGGLEHLDTVLAILTTHHIKAATTSYVTTRFLKEWEPCWTFHQQFAQRYVEAYHLLADYPLTCLYSELSEPDCQPWDIHCRLLNHLRWRRTELAALSHNQRRALHAE